MRERAHDGPLCCGTRTWLIVERTRARIYWCDVCNTSTAVVKS